MPDFSYRSLDREGEVQTGMLKAASRGAAVAELYRRGHTPLDLSADGPTFLMRLNEPVTLFSRAGPRDVQAFLRDLARLLDAGLSVDDSLKLIEEMQDKELFARTLADIRERVRQGDSLAVALSEHKRDFNVQVVAAVQAGELSGTLSEALATLSASLDQALSFKERLRSALIYPSILMVMVVVTLTLVLTFVLPQFAPLFNGNEDKLPAATRFVMALGAFFEAWWPLVALGVAGVIMLGVFVFRSATYRYRLFRGLCRVPWIKGWLLTPDIVRFTRTVGLCSRSGVPLDKALSMAIDAVRMPHVAERFLSIRAQVRHGGNLSTALKKVEWFPALVVQFAQVGEQSGKLGAMLDEAATLMGQDYEARLEKALGTLSPLLTLVMGGIVALLVGSVLLGIMSINNVVQ